jgi:drug/metabolite transporter (DMT)-like permease
MRIIENKNRLKGIGFILIASLGYGLMPSISQLAFENGVNFDTMLANRYIIALSVTWAYIFFKRINPRISKSQFLFLMGIGVIYVGIALFINLSYLYLPGAIASILVFLYVSLVVIFEIIIGREKPNSTKIICVIISLVGLILVVWSPTGEQSLSLIGVFFALCGGVCYAVYATILGGTKAVGIDSTVLVGYVLIIPSIFYPIRCIALGQPLISESILQFGFIVLIAVLCTFLATLWFCIAVKINGSSTTAIINTMEPVIAYFAGMVIMGDVVGINAVFGGILIITAILILNIAEGSKERISLDR